jgi:hypothetical protein
MLTRIGIHQCEQTIGYHGDRQRFLLVANDYPHAERIACAARSLRHVRQQLVVIDKADRTITCRKRELKHRLRDCQSVGKEITRRVILGGPVQAVVDMSGVVGQQPRPLVGQTKGEWLGDHGRQTNEICMR